MVRRGSKSSTGSKRHVYKKRSYTDLEKRQQQRGGGFDSLFNDKLSVLKMSKKESVNIRFLPPLWNSEATHYGEEIWIHSDVGPNHGQYLCADKMFGKPCSICEDREDSSADNHDYAALLKPKKRVIAYILDRDDEAKGIQLINMPWTLDRDISLQSGDERTKEVLFIDDFDKGFDVSFIPEKKGDYTNYIGHKVARNSSPLLDDTKLQDELLDYVTDHSILDNLENYNYDYIKSAHCGKKQDEGQEEVEEDVPDFKAQDDSHGKEEASDEALTWDHVHEMKGEDLDVLATGDEVGMADRDLNDFADDKELADHICETLGIEETKVKSKLRKLRGSRT